MNGVSGVEELKLMVGDSVTLNSAETSSKETIQWLFGTKRIAEIRESRDPQYYDERFKDQLELDKKTGSLTIKNINTYHSGQYRQNIADINRINIAIQVRGVTNVSVMMGDTVTLHTGVTLKDTVKWTFENKDLNPTDGQNEDLTITIIDNRHCGDYVLEVNSSTMGLRRTYCIVLIGEKQRVSVTEGENVFLITGVKDIQTYDLILNLEGRTIAEIYTNDHSGNNNRDARLLLDILNGSLIIRNSATTDTGDYDLTMSSSTYSLQRTISVTVSNSGLSAAALAGIVVGLLVFVALMGFLCYCCKTSAK